MGLGDGDAEQPQVAHLVDDLGGEAVVALERAGHRNDLLGDEPADGVDDLEADVLVGGDHG